MSSLASPARPEWAPTRCERLRNFMLLGAWYNFAQLEAVGGRRFPARLHEIARGADGRPALAYDCEAVEGQEGAFKYRLREFREGEERPAPKRRRTQARLDELVRENLQLKARVAELEGAGVGA